LNISNNYTRLIFPTILDPLPTRAMRPRRVDLQLQRTVLALYRKCLRMSGRLVYEHQNTWYDYTKIKFRGNRDIHDQTKIKRFLRDAEEELDFVEKMLKMKGR
jgi:hypothetical protein